MPPYPVLTVAGEQFGSALMAGNRRLPEPAGDADALAASGAEIVTVSIRRVDLSGPRESLVRAFGAGNIAYCPTRPAARRPRDAVLTAGLAREALDTNWVKLEVVGDRETLYPDVEQLLRAAATLVEQGFAVLAYTNDDPITCEKLADLGCATVMPLGAPIGSGMGILNPYNIEAICRRLTVPVILDAGIGTASDARGRWSWAVPACC